MASRVVEVLYRLKDLFTSQATKIVDKYRDIRRESRTTADSIERDNDRTERGFGSVIASLNRMRTALLAAFATAGGAASINNVANELDRLGKTAARLDIDPGLLAAYGFAAERSGVQVGVMEKSLADLQRRIGEAAIGLGEAKVAFERLGIDAANFANLGLEEQMGILADRLSNVASEEERAALAAKLFGESGVQLLQVLNGGSAALAELVRKGREFTNVTKEQTDAAAAYTDALANLSAVVQGIKFNVGGAALQGISQTLGSFGLLATETANLKAQLNEARAALRSFELGGGPPQLIEETRRRFEQLSQAVADIEDRGQDPILVGMRVELENLNAELARTEESSLSNLWGVFGKSAEDLQFQIMDLERAINDYTFAQSAATTESKKAAEAAAAQAAEDKKTLATIEALKAAQEGRKKAAEEAYRQETAELRSARQQQLQIEKEFADLRKSLTQEDKETSLVDVALKQRQASAALERGEAQKAIDLAREGADLLGALKDQSGQSSVALGFFSKELEKIANKAAAANVEKELLDAEKVRAEVTAATAALGEISEAMKQQGVAAAKAFLDSFTATMQAAPPVTPNVAAPSVPETRIVRDGNSFSMSARQELEKRGRK